MTTVQHLLIMSASKPEDVDTLIEVPNDTTVDPARVEAMDCIEGCIEPSCKIHRRILTKFADDRSIMLPFVGRCGQGLEFASGRLQDDREIVLTAVAGWGQCSRICFGKTAR